MTLHLCFTSCMFAGISPPSEERVTPEPPEDTASTGPLRSHPHRHAMMKRLTRTDNRRYHTAGAIDDIKVCTYNQTTFTRIKNLKRSTFLDTICKSSVLHISLVT